MCTPVDVGDVEEPPRLAGGGRGARESQQQHRGEAGPPQRSHSLRPHYGVSVPPPNRGFLQSRHKTAQTRTRTGAKRSSATAPAGFTGENEGKSLSRSQTTTVDINF